MKARRNPRSMGQAARQPVRRRRMPAGHFQTEAEGRPDGSGIIPSTHLYEVENLTIWR